MLGNRKGRSFIPTPYIQMKKTKNALAKHKEKLDLLKDFLLTIVGFGILINFMLWGIFGLPFSVYSLIAYGILYYFIDSELIKWIKQIKMKGVIKW